jgi:hypothetical protein
MVLVIMVTCRYNVPVVSPGKTKKWKVSKQNKTKQNNQNGIYDINIEGHASTASPSPSLWQALEKTGCAPLLSGVKCSVIARWFSGRLCQEDCPADHPGLQGESCSPRAPAGRAFSAPTESMMQWLPSCWCLLCRITCRFDTCLHCTSLAMLARTSMAGATRTHTFRALLLCVGSSSSAPTRKGGVYVWRLRPQLSLLLHQFGVEPCALCIADYNNHICICFVLFCFVLFCFVIFSLF